MSDLVPTGMSELDIYLRDRYTPQDTTNQLTSTPEEAADIRKKCSYVRKKWYFPVLENLGPIPKGLTSPLGTPTAGLGPFEKLPGDIVSNILLRLDVKSFRNFRNLNAKAHRITETVIDCKDVMVHGKAAFISISRTGLSRHITIGEIHLALTSHKCNFCEEYGPLLFLPTCTRTCHECLRTSPRMAMIGTEEILPFYTRFGMYKGHGNRSHLLKSLRKSSMAVMKVRDHLRPRRMIKNARCVRVGLRDIRLDASPVRQGMAPLPDRCMRVLEKGLSCRGCQEAFNERRLQAIATGTTYGAVANRDTCYSHESFQEHFQNCEHAKLVWENSELPGREAWFAANGGAHWGITERTEYCGRFVAQLPEVNNEEFWVSVGVAAQVVFYACLLIGYAKWHTLAASSGGV
ncbi:hypothetical protein CEK25_009398 [Fusarium fujikuroi]|nr:hypothetical protein CEK25_009398 [Fusarium fujikuroi]